MPAPVPDAETSSLAWALVAALVDVTVRADPPLPSDHSLKLAAPADPVVRNIACAFCFFEYTSN